MYMTDTHEHTPVHIHSHPEAGRMGIIGFLCIFYFSANYVWEKVTKYMWKFPSHLSYPTITLLSAISFVSSVLPPNNDAINILERENKPQSPMEV